TLFIGWPGGTWTPPTERALQFMVDNLPGNCIWNVSVMNPQKQWPILALAVALGGHVRVGYEDNPYIAPGEFARNNAVLVERMVAIARGVGREIASPDEARKILGLTRPQCLSPGLMLRRIAAPQKRVNARLRRAMRAAIRLEAWGRPHPSRHIHASQST